MAETDTDLDTLSAIAEAGYEEEGYWHPHVLALIARCRAAEECGQVDGKSAVYWHERWFLENGERAAALRDAALAVCYQCRAQGMPTHDGEVWRHDAYGAGACKAHRIHALIARETDGEGSGEGLDLPVDTAGGAQSARRPPST